MPFQEFACNGLWVASSNGDYKDRIWIRDSVFIILYYMEMGESSVTIVQDALDTIGKLWDVSSEDNDYARPAVCYSRDLKPVSVPNYLTGESADIQNDTLGEILWLYCEAYEKGLYTFTPNWDRVIENILATLFRERYWEQADAGFWEMEPSLRASSVGICVSGLRRLLFMDATKQWSSSWDAERVRILLEKGYETLYKLLPNETSNRAYDSSLLYLIWPFAVVDGIMSLHIIGRVLENLKGWVGFRRFVNDPYYLYGGEVAEWGMTSPHMLLCMNEIGLYPVEEDPKDWAAIKLLGEKNYPESFVGLEKEPNANTPLAWTKAMCLLAKSKLSHTY
jgi:phosphorylase kinase alpha/beta subunit